jgi:hypothetical protein
MYHDVIYESTVHEAHTNSNVNEKIIEPGMAFNNLKFVEFVSDFVYHRINFFAIFPCPITNTLSYFLM